MGLSAAAFARRVKVDPKTIRNYELGVHDVTPLVLKRARRLAARAEGAKTVSPKSMQEDLPLENPPVPEPQEALSDPPVPPGSIAPPEPITHERLKQARMELGLSQRAMAELFNIHSSYYHAMEKGTHAVSAKYHAFCQVLFAYAFSDKREGPVPRFERDPHEKPRGRRPGPVSSEPRPQKRERPLSNNEVLLAATTEFYEQYRAERNQRDVQAFIEFAENKFGLKRQVAVQYLLTALYTLTKDMTVESLCECLGKVR